MGEIMTGTPGSLTYLHPAVQDAWKVVWVVIAAGLGVVLAWAGITIILNEHLGGRGSGWRELVPRLLIAVVGASTSLWWASFIIDLADSISAFVAVSLDVTPNDLLRGPLDLFLNGILTGTTGVGIAVAVLYLIYGFFALYVIGQFIIRLALIDLLLVMGPAALGLWVLPSTAGWGRYWLRMFLVTVFQQSIQLVSLSLAFSFLNQIADPQPGQPVSDFLWQLLLSIAFVYLTTRVPSMLGTTGVFDAWFRTITYATNTLAHLPAALGVAGRIAMAVRMGGGGASPSARFMSSASSLMAEQGQSTLPGRSPLALPPASSPPALPPRSMDE